MFINASLSSLSTSVEQLPFHQVLICGTYVLPQLWQFWDNIRSKLANKGLYKVSIGKIRLRLAELQKSDKKARKIKAEGLNEYKELNEILYHQGLLFIPKAIRTEIISRHHDDHLARHFGIYKTKDLIGWKNYWPSLQKNIETYIKGCDICLGLKAVRHKPYANLQSLPISPHWWKDLLIDFVKGLPISTDWKGDSYDSILVIIDVLTKIVCYEPVKITIGAPGLAKVILDMVVRYHGLPDSIMSDKGSLFTSKFWSSLCYFLDIKWRLSTAFHPQTDGQTKRQNNTIEEYFWAFLNFK